MMNDLELIEKLELEMVCGNNCPMYHQTHYDIRKCICYKKEIIGTFKQRAEEIEKLKGEIGLCEKLSSDLIYNKAMVEILQNECGKNFSDKDEEHQKKVADLKQLLCKWQDAFHYRGERLYKQQAQIQIITAENKRLKNFQGYAHYVGSCVGGNEMPKKFHEWLRLVDDETRTQLNQQPLKAGV